MNPVLFGSFWTNRYQYVSLENHQLNLKKLIMVFLKVQYWHLFFLTFILMITCVSCTPRLFANDTCLIAEDKNINDLHKKITTENTSPNKWMIAIKPVLRSRSKINSTLTPFLTLSHFFSSTPTPTLTPGLYFRSTLTPHSGKILFSTPTLTPTPHKNLRLPRLRLPTSTLQHCSKLNTNLFKNVKM